LKAIGRGTNKNPLGNLTFKKRSKQTRGDETPSFFSMIIN